ncbi:MAG: transposase [Verrucomicrobiia bacterium]
MAIPLIAHFRRLYRIEAQTKDLTPQERHQVRQREATPIWVQLAQDAQALKPQLLPHSSLGKAVSYLNNEYQALIGYLDSGVYQIDNNASWKTRCACRPLVGAAGSLSGILRPAGEAR